MIDEPAEILSGPTRKLSMSQEKNELEKELGDIRKEVIESRNLVIKTDNLLKNLHAELKMVGKRQEDFQKRQWLSSAVAYVGFAVIAVGAGLMISSARTAGATADHDRQEKQINELTQQAERQRTEAQTQAAAQRAASEVYRQMTTGPADDRLKGVDSLVKLDTSKISWLERQALSDRAELLRKEVGQAAFEKGKAAFRRSDMPEVVTNLTRFLTMNPEPQDQLEASFFLGVAFNQLHKHDQAVPLLARWVAEDKHAKGRDYAMMLLAQSYQETNQLEKAIQTAREAAAEYPNSEFMPQMKWRIAAVKKAQKEAAEAAAANNNANNADAAATNGGPATGGPRRRQAPAPATTPAEGQPQGAAGQPQGGKTAGAAQPVPTARPAPR